MASEGAYQNSVIRRIMKMYPHCYVLKNDPLYIQGIPDLTILLRTGWATLECKTSSTAAIRPNQQYYVKKMNALSFSRFIFPENEEEVFDAIQRSFIA